MGQMDGWVNEEIVGWSDGSSGRRETATATALIS